jgi:outer membrane protein assembly factor BamA
VALLLTVIFLLSGAGVIAAEDKPRDPPPARRGFWGATQAPNDSLGAFAGCLWGPVPARDDSVSAGLRNRSRPGWETAVMVPYWIVGIPFRIVYFGLDQAVIGMDKLGLFAAGGEYPGLKVPGGAYLMPVISIGDLEGWTFGLQLTRPNFLGPNNMLFIQGSRSTRKADELSGGTLFQLGKGWAIQVGGGTEEKNLTRYYGMGPDSYNGDLSYYFRRTTWGGFELDKDVGHKTALELRTFFSQVEALEPDYNVDQSLGRVHADDIPYGYPGQSNGWTGRLGLYRDNADQRGRPRRGGFQSLGVSLFQASDGSQLQFLTYHIDLEKFYPLWHTDRTLALRGFFNRISNTWPVDIPFTRLVTFQRPDELRGFSSLRYYGMGSMGFSVEYRWPVWVARGRNDLGVDAYIFSDIGQVFDKTAEISITNMRGTGGVGLRLINSNRGFSARFELGLSEEQTIVRLKFSQTFQYDSKGLLYGKNPIRFY